MVDLQTVIEELNTGRIEFDYKDDDCCTTEGEVVILLKRLAELENADGVEVKHGEWIKTDRGIRKSVNTGQPMRVYACDCSCCGYHTGNQGTEFNYCPHCGAKMDGGDK